MKAQSQSALDSTFLAEYQTLHDATLAARLANWRIVLRDLDQTADAAHTVVRLPNSSSYIFTTGGRHWAVDPAYAVRPCPAAELQEVTNGLRALDFIIITHCHGDHLQRAILRDFVADSNKRIIIPAAIAEMFFKLTAISPSQVTVVPPGETLRINDLALTVYPGYHDEPGMPPFPAGSLLITLPDGIRLFFPGDIRDYAQPWPPAAMGADYLFGHVWLGREIAANATFPLLDPFCRFMSSGRPKTIFLAHLCEVSRDVNSMWTPRHAALVTSRLSEVAPEINVATPRHGAVVPLTKPARQDLFHGWTSAAQDDFLRHLGVSIDFSNWRTTLEQVIADRVPALEFTGTVPPPTELAELQTRLVAWRAAGGRTLSGHLCEIRPEPAKQAAHQTLSRAFLSLGVDRVTQHVPQFSVAEVNADLERMLNLFAAALQPLIAANVAIGIENMHMKAGMPHDDNRRFGSIPAESIAFVEALRQRTGYPGIGFHFDIGHAATNHPFAKPFPPAAWLAAAGSLINGVHLHQFLRAPSDAQPYPEGHHHICGRLAGYPSLRPLYEAWQTGVLRAPMFLEVRRGVEPDPFLSLARLRRREFG